jgi:1-deoxy-D-xylulose-5-phosphate reductoisomerase
MRTPIAYGLGFPERISSGVGMLDLALAGRLDFSQPDLKQLPCLSLSFQALKAGQGACVALNAANEVAVAAFLERRLAYTQISQVIEDTLSWQAGQSTRQLESLGDIIALDEQARSAARRASAI